jgi:hypothetical protein
MQPRVALRILAIVLLAAGCGGRPDFASLDRSAPGIVPEPAEAMMLLLAAGEDDDIDEAPASALRQPPPAPAQAEDSRLALRVGLGMALPGAGAIGSARGRTVPAYADVWTAGFALEATGEFGTGDVRPYARVVAASFQGQRWTDPGNPDDSWLASDGTVTRILGGARFDIGPAYATAGLGVALMPQMSRIDYFTGREDVILEDGAAFAFSLGGGAEFTLGNLRAYADLSLDLIGARPDAATEDAVLQWPHFEAEPMNVLTLAGGISLAF